MSESGDNLPEFALTEQAIDDLYHVVAFRGELDMFSAPALTAALLAAIDAGRIRVIVDLTETTFLASAGLGPLIAAHKRLRPLGGALAIVNVDVDGPIARVFVITGLDGLFTIVATRDDAIEALATTPMS